MVGYAFAALHPEGRAGRDRSPSSLSAWNPAEIEQRTGRVDRIGGKAIRERQLVLDRLNRPQSIPFANRSKADQADTLVMSACDPGCVKRQKIRQATRMIFLRSIEASRYLHGPYSSRRAAY